jgi:hypothetical protein
MGINPRKIHLRRLATYAGSIEWTGDEFIFEGVENGERFLEGRREQLRKEQGVEEPTPEQLFRFIVLRYFSATALGAWYADGDGPELTREEIHRNRKTMHEYKMGRGRALATTTRDDKTVRDIEAAARKKITP